MCFCFNISKVGVIKDTNPYINFGMDSRILKEISKYYKKISLCNIFDFVVIKDTNRY